MAGHLDERRLRRGHDAERLADRAALLRHHPKEQIGRLRLIAFEDGIGQQVEGFVLADLVAAQQHRCSPWTRRGPGSGARAYPLPARCVNLPRPPHRAYPACPPPRLPPRNRRTTRSAAEALE